MIGYRYTVLNAVESEGIRLMRLRNPWHHGEWKGDWCDGSSLWYDNRNVADTVGLLENDDDGRFWISIEDFCERFSTVDFVQVSGGHRKTPLSLRLRELTGQAGSSNSGEAGDGDDDDWLAGVTLPGTSTGKKKSKQKKRKGKH